MKEDAVVIGIDLPNINEFALEFVTANNYGEDNCEIIAEAIQSYLNIHLSDIVVNVFKQAIKDE